MSIITQPNSQGISTQSVKNRSELIDEVAKTLNLTTDTVSSVIGSYSDECVRLVGQGSSIFLSDMYFVKVSEIGSAKKSSHRIVPYGAILREVSKKSGVSYFTVQTVVNTLLTLCLFHASKGKSARVSGLVTFKQSESGDIKVSYGSGVRNTKTNKNLRVSIKDLNVLISA